VWDKATAQAEIGDTFRIPFAPIFQVVEKEVLKDGRVRLKVMPLSSSYTEEWVLEPEPAVEARDSTQRCQLPLNWEAMEEFKHGRAHGIHDASGKLEPICTEGSCPYSTGYLEGYKSIVQLKPQPEVVKPPEWSVTYNREWDWYTVWVGERPVDRAFNHEEAEQKAQKYIAGDKFWQEHRQAALAAYVS
jgi:hypothetical protein